MRRIDAQLRQAKKKLAAAVKASGTTITEVFGVGPVIAATVIGEVGNVSRFRNRDHFAAYNGTAPVEVSSGNRKIYRLSLRGNRRLNHAIHMAAITQIRHPHSDGRAYYDRKIAEGKTTKEALRCPQAAHQRRHLRRGCAPTPASAAAKAGPGGQAGNVSVSSAAGSHPGHRLFGHSHSRTRAQAYAQTRPRNRKSAAHKPQRDEPNHLTQRGFDLGGISSSVLDALAV